MIVAPILAIIALSMAIFEGTINPDNNKNISKIKNIIIALMIIFFIPLLINIVSSIVGEKTTLTSCWNSAHRSSSKIKFYDKKAKSSKKTNVYINPKDYHGKTTQENTSNSNNNNNYQTNSYSPEFSCTSKKVRSQFSCDTLKIVEKHLYDFDATNFDKVIASYGGFDQYVKTVGGIFSEYYGKKIKPETEKDFQVAAEYVLGWIYMYGWDSGFINDHFGDWGKVYCGGHHCPDAFYANGGWKGGKDWSWRPYDTWNQALAYRGPYTDFDDVISGKARGGIHNLVLICGDAPNFIYNKLGLRAPTGNPQLVSLRDLRVGDEINFWSNDKQSAHTVIVGEVYSDHVVVYDTGGSYTDTMNYKRSITIPKQSSRGADLAAIKNTYGAYKFSENWGIRRSHDFKRG